MGAHVCMTTRKKKKKKVGPVWRLRTEVHTLAVAHTLSTMSDTPALYTLNTVGSSFSIHFIFPNAGPELSWI